MKYDGEVFTALLNGKDTIQSNSFHDHSAMGNYKGDPFIIGGRREIGLRDPIPVTVGRTLDV